jgi:hypothetical protein
VTRSNAPAAFSAAQGVLLLVITRDIWSIPNADAAHQKLIADFSSSRIS